MTINKLDDLDNNEDFEAVEFDLDKIKSKILTHSSKKLCEMIVCDRYFGSYKEMSAACMEELVKRRVNGDTFNYEDYINDALKELPVLNFAVPDLGTVLRGLIGTQVKK